MSKNKFIEKAYQIYLHQLICAEYIKSFKQLAEDIDTIRHSIAEEGMEEYLKQLEP